jgi:hypothetical protein
MTNLGERTVRLHGFGKAGQGELTLAGGGTYEADLCSDTAIAIQVTNSTCDVVRIDSIAVLGNNPEDFVAVDETPRNVAVGEVYTLRGTFAPSQAGPRSATIRVYYSDKDGTHMREITIAGSGIGSSPITASLPVDTTMHAMILEDLTMPIYVQGVSLAPITAVEVTLGLRTDLLTPRALDLTGMVMDGAQIGYFDVKNDSVSFRLEFPTPRIIGQGILAKVLYRTFLTDTMETWVRLLRFDAETNSTACLSTTVQGGADQAAYFELDPQCGDQIISGHMRDDLLGLKIESVHPNPSRGRVSLKLDMPASSPSATINVYDATGKIVLTEQIERRNTRVQDVKLNIPGGAGKYYIRAESAAGSSTRAVVVTK